MSYALGIRLRGRFRFPAILLTLVLALHAQAYDQPLSANAIREAYFLGTRQSSLGADFLGQYAHTIPELKVGGYTSVVRIETPFVLVALHASRTMNYSAQDALRDFYNKPLPLRVYLDISYKPSASPQNSIRIKVVQNGKEVAPISDDRSPYYPRVDKRTSLPSIGEHVQLEFAPEKLDSSTVTILIDTPDGQHGETTFPLQTLR